MFDEPAFWLFAFVVAIIILRSWLKGWLQHRRVAERRERQRRLRAETTDADRRLNATLRVEERTSHVQIPGLTESEKERLLAAYSGCAYCGEPVESGANLHWDHVLPLTLGGANHVDNVVPACSSCNLRKGSKHPDRWYAELGQPPLHLGVAAKGHLEALNLDRVRDAEYVLLMTGGEGQRADRARRFLAATEDTHSAREARLEGARQALDSLAPEWRGYYRRATPYRSARVVWPRTEDPVPLAEAYRQVRHLERLTNAPLRTIGSVMGGAANIERLPVEQWKEKEAFRKSLGKNIWGRR